MGPVNGAAWYAVTVARRSRIVEWPAAAGNLRFEFLAGRDSVGYVTLKSDDGPTIDYIFVRETWRRRGVATALYEAAARGACRSYGVPLQSDVERSAAAQAFWVKQVRKGRATCVRPTPKVGRVQPTAYVMGRGGCYRYALTCPAPASLARARRV